MQGTPTPRKRRRELERRRQESRKRRWTAVGIAAATLLLLVPLALSAPPLTGDPAPETAAARDPGELSGPGTRDRAPAEPKDPRPNVITIVTDDQDEMLFRPEIMPNTFALFDDGATQLTNFTITTPLCCPSRATQLTGQYGHNNGVLANDPGYPALREPDNVLPAWLQRAGYTTARIGRFLNGYEPASGSGDQAEPAPGWDHWIGLVNLHYRDYELSLDGERVAVNGRSKDSYVTRDLDARARGLVADLAGQPEPFYMQIDELAPHSDHQAEGACKLSAVPGPKSLEPLGAVRLPANPARERDVSDKPAYIRRLPEIDEAAREQIQQRIRCRAASLREVDRGIGRLVQELRDLGIYEDTVLIFYSDNGYFSGQHRLLKSKGLPYEESVQVPAMVRVPEQILGARPDAASDLPLANIDLAPTVLDLAEADPCVSDDRCRLLDGRSMLPALSDPGEWPENRSILIEVDQERSLAGGTLACTWAGVRRRAQVYVDYIRVARSHERDCEPTQESEHYRLQPDPHERDNLWPPQNDRDERAQQRLRKILFDLRSCAGNPESTPGSGVATPCE